MAPKKQKGEKMDLGTFLGDSSLGSWADEMEDAPMPTAPSGRGAYGGDRGHQSGSGYGGGGGYDRGYTQREQLPLPTKPPYTVHLGNMSFDATEGDIQDFFAGCSVTSVRIVEDRIDKKPKGFGYAEFATLEGLKKALEANGTQFQGRNIRVSVAEPQKERPDVREFNDWTRKGPLPDIAPRRASDRGGFGGGRGSGGFDSASEASNERGPRRGGYEPSDGKIRDFNNWDRKGPLTPTIPTGPATKSFERPVSRDGPRFERRNSPSWGEGRSDAGSRPPRREFAERPPPMERTPTAAEQDNQWRARMKPDPPPAPPVAPVQAARSPALSNRELSSPPSPAGGPPVAPATRPKLNLAKRTVSDVHPDPATAAAAPGADTKASPFGGARPIDTATREKEIDEKRRIAIREKKEAEEKARIEKKIAEDKAKEEKRLAREAELAAKAEQKPKANENGNVQPKDKANGQPKLPKDKSKENGSVPPPGKSFEILRRAANDDASMADEEADEADGVDEADVTNDKDTKPKEIVQDPSKPVENGASINGTLSAEPTAQALEDEGWSTVASKDRRKNGRQAARAIAS